MEILVREKDPVLYRCDFESSWGGKFGLFRDYSNLLIHLILALLIFFLLHACLNLIGSLTDPAKNRLVPL